MSVSLKAIIAAVATFSAISAQAEMLGPHWMENIEFTQHDLELIHSTIAQRVHGKPVGTTANWNNPASGNYGSITLEKKLVVNHQQCEEIGYVFRSRKPDISVERYHFTSCLQPGGTWKIVF